MKIVIQRVTSASVTINSAEKREINKGLVVLLGIGLYDTSETCRRVADKILALRIFPNEDGKFSKSITDINGELLVVSQFTLYGDTTRGRRPDFTAAARPEQAITLYEEFVKCLKASPLKVVTGEFAADMLVNINNDGPVTIIIDTEEHSK
jgi:D-tyrosyl-tRNA(Tyr) deacylase